MIKVFGWLLKPARMRASMSLQPQETVLRTWIVLITQITETVETVDQLSSVQVQLTVPG